MKAMFAIKATWLVYSIEGDTLEVKCGSGLTNIAFMMERGDGRIAVASRGPNMAISSEDVDVSITCADYNFASMAAAIEEWAEEEA